MAHAFRLFTRAGMALSGTLAVALGSGCLSKPMHARMDEDSAEDEVVVSLDRVPAAARSTIESRVGAARIHQIEWSTSDGQVWYEVEATGTDGTFEFAVDEDGTFLGMEEDEDGDEDDDDEDDEVEDDDDEGDEVTVTLEQVPAAARTTIEQHVKGGRITELERSEQDGRVIFEVEINGTKDFSVAEDGTFLGTEEDDDDEEDDR